MKNGSIAANLGIGLVAGFVGTLAITASQRVEMRITKRQKSKTPAKGAERVFDIKPDSEQSEERLNTTTHFAYGTSWGAFRGLLGSIGITGSPATVLHWAAVQGTAMVMLPSLRLAPPPKQWGAKALGIEMLHHAVYAIAAGATYEALSRGVTQPEEEGHLLRNVALGFAAATGVSRLMAGDHHEERREDGHLLRNLIAGTAAYKGVKGLFGGEERKEEHGSKLWGLAKAGIAAAGLNKLVEAQDRYDRGLVDRARELASDVRHRDWADARRVLAGK